MTVVGVSMVKDEADIVGDTVAQMLRQVDAVIVADNMSTDGTTGILATFAEDRERVRIVVDADPRYRQSAKMTGLAHRARSAFGADWIVPFDADEWWYSPFGRIGEVLEQIGQQWLAVPAPLYDHVVTAVDPDPEAVPSPINRIGWRRPDPAPLPKVAVRWRPDLVIEQGNHSATYDGGTTLFDPVLTIRHYPYRSVDQLVRKVRNGAAAYRAADLSVDSGVRRDHGAHWRQWGDLLDAGGEAAIDELFSRWYWRHDPRAALHLDDGEIQPPLIFDPAPR
jgi:glycosyltransferase involved in cell wall biosynthesis